MNIIPCQSITTQCYAFFEPETEEVEIRQGSILHINPDIRGGVPEGNFASINEYICNGIVVRNADGTLTVNSSIFESPSAAWVMVSGKCGSGWKNWIINDEGSLLGRPLDEFRQTEKSDNRISKFLPISKKELSRIIYKSDETDLYTQLADFFKKHSRFYEFNTFETLRKSPNLSGPGVYVIKKNSGETIYVGMSGKIKRDINKIVLNSGTINKRITTSTDPYTFDLNNGENVIFRYSPNYSQSKIKNYPMVERYAECFNMRDLVIHCFILQNAVYDVCPSLLESIILQNHFKLFSDLPIANNAL